MADNFTVLKQQLDTAINPNAAPGQPKPTGGTVIEVGIEGERDIWRLS